MTISELERYSRMVRDMEPSHPSNEVADAFLDVIADWRVMRDALVILRMQSWNQSIPLDFAQTQLDRLKVKP